VPLAAAVVTMLRKPFAGTITDLYMPKKASR
jgi:hypothetical protein